MTRFTKHITLSKTTTLATAEDVIDRSNVAPLKWFSLIVSEDAYIGINEDASATTMKLLAGEAYSTPEKVRVFKISVMRVSSNVVVRGSAWY